MKKFFLGIVTAIAICISSFAFAGCGDKKGKSENVNIIMASASIPPMLAMLDTINNENTTNYIWVGRQNTIASTANLKAAYGKNSMIEEWSTASNIPATVVEQMSQAVANAYYGNPKTKFNIYVTDYGVLSALYLVKSINVPESNYKIHLLEDGSGAYSQFRGEGDNQNYDAADGYTRFAANLAELNGIIATMVNGSYNAAQNFASYKYVYPATTLPNVDYYLQYPEMLSSENAQIQAMLSDGTMKLTKKHQTEMYQNLSASAQAKIRGIILNPALDTLMAPEAGKDKILMITGTAFTDEGNALADPSLAGKDDRFEQYVQYLYDRYGDEYTIVYKGHPSWGLLENELETSRWMDASRLPNGWTVAQGRAAAARRKAFFESLGIRVLSAQTPAEAIIWAYSDVLHICGYDSSLYFNAPSEKMVCFLAKTETDAATNKYEAHLSDLNAYLFQEGGQLYNPDLYFLDLAYIAANPINA